MDIALNTGQFRKQQANQPSRSTGFALVGLHRNGIDGQISSIVEILNPFPAFPGFRPDDEKPA